MKHNGWVFTSVLALILGLSAGMATLSGQADVTASDSPSGRKLIVIDKDAHLVEFDLTGLADGETRTIEAEGHVFTVTRTSDTFKVAMDGKDLGKDGHVITTGDQAGKMRITILDSGTTDGATAGGEQREVFVWKDGDNADSIRIMKIRSSDAEGQDMVIIKEPGQETTLRLEDLADGEVREFGDADHLYTVTREGDRLVVRRDGEPLPDTLALCGESAAGKESMVWVSGDREKSDGGNDTEEHRFEVKVIQDGQKIKVFEHVIAGKDGSEMVILENGHPRSLSIGDLADGESRTFGDADHPVTVTRHGDQLEVKINGETMVMSGSDKCGDKEHSVVVVGNSSGKDISTTGKKVMVWHEAAGSADGNHIRVEVTARNGQVDLKINGETIQLDLDEFPDGETRTYTLEGKPLDITRHGNRLTLKLDGKEMNINVIPSTDDDNL